MLIIGVVNGVVVEVVAVEMMLLFLVVDMGILTGHADSVVNVVATVVLSVKQAIQKCTTHL